MSKILKTIHSHGSEQSKRTRWKFWPAWIQLEFTDGTTKYMGDIAFNDALRIAKESGVDTSEFERLQAESAVKPYPEKPTAELYQHNWGYEKPIALGEWQWSTTFGRWSRLVTFADGWSGYSYPKTF